MIKTILRLGRKELKKPYSQMTVHVNSSDANNYGLLS